LKAKSGTWAIGWAKMRSGSLLTAVPAVSMKRPAF